MMTRLRTIAPIVLSLITILLLHPALSVAQQGKTPAAKPPAEQKHRIDTFLDACMEKDVSTAGMLDCLRRANQMWDAEMNATYRKLMAKLPVKGQADLKASQRAWIAFRDREYKFMNSMFSQLQGTMYLPMRADAGMRLTKERAEQLDSLLAIYTIDERM